MARLTFTSLTADQWKIAFIYARPYLSGLLSTNAYKSICLLCENVEFIAKPIHYTENITTLYGKLNDHHKLYASVYRKWEVSVNYHYALHIPVLIISMIMGLLKYTGALHMK